MGLTVQACLPEVMIERHGERHEGESFLGIWWDLVVGGRGELLGWFCEVFGWCWVVLSVAFSVDTASLRLPTCQTCQRANACMYRTERVQLSYLYRAVPLYKLCLYTRRHHKGEFHSSLA